MKRYKEVEEIDIDELTLGEISELIQKKIDQYGKDAILQRVTRYAYPDDRTSWEVWTINVRETKI